MRTDLLGGARRAAADAYARSEEAMAWLLRAYGELWTMGWRWTPLAVLAAPVFAVAVVLLVLSTAIAVVLAATLYLGGFVAVVAAPWLAIAWAVTAVAGGGGESRAAPAGATCEPSYPDFCIPADSFDVDCPGGGGPGPYAEGKSFRVRGADPYQLDRDDDGIGCEEA